MTNRTKIVVAAVLLYAVWTATTWVLEGRIETFLRPDAVLDRLVYALVANLLVGLLGGVVVLRAMASWGAVDRIDAGFGSRLRSAVAVVAGLVLGLGFYLLSGGITSNPIAIANAFAQVFVVSAAEVVVCWAVVAGAVAGALKDSGRWIAIPVAAVVASVLFGAYHFAHSAPFDTLGMVAFLSVIGLVTSLFFFVSRDVYGTIVFHNFMGVLGVVNALAANDLLDRTSALDPRLFATLMVAVLVLAALDRFVLRRPLS